MYRLNTGKLRLVLQPESDAQKVGGLSATQSPIIPKNLDIASEITRWEFQIQILDMCIRSGDTENITRTQASDPPTNKNPCVPGIRLSSATGNCRNSLGHYITT